VCRSPKKTSDGQAVPELIPAAPLLVAFLIASLVLAVTPGPGVIYIVARSLARGRRAGLASVAGVAAGNFCNALGASVGLAALFAVSSLAFTLVKFAGAGYLVYLGISALRAPDPSLDAIGSPIPPSGAFFRDGFVVALFNPKTTIFFAAFLPQFMQPASSHLIQSMVLGALFVGIAAVTDTLYALGARALANGVRNLQPVRRAGRYATAAALLGLGVMAALSDVRGK
jgi:threonine/homoserine/homoserine lactone efflux protein